METTMTDEIEAAENSRAASGLEAELTDVAALAEALTAAQVEAEQSQDLYLRTAAELENIRKRSARDVENARKFGIERFAEDLLAAVDSLELGLEAGVGASAESLLEGKQATLKLLLAALQKAGVAGIDPEGEPFDPQLHEAMTVQPSATAEPGSVLTVVQKGYQLNGRLLRPARVIVAGEAESADS